jgi:hypothetical protein
MLDNVIKQINDFIEATAQAIMADPSLSLKAKVSRLNQIVQGQDKAVDVLLSLKSTINQP